VYALIVVLQGWGFAAIVLVVSLAEEMVVVKCVIGLVGMKEMRKGSGNVFAVALIVIVR
jgi:hypothetical protein